jgi:glutamate 5-kinase
VKIGASLLFSDKTQLDCGLVNELTGQICSLNKEGKELVVVSSGAIAVGMSVLGLRERPKELSHLQAVAAIGQHELMDVYRRFFKQRQLNCAQLLLTWEDFDNRKRYLNAKNTLFTLLKLNSIPIINENDTVSTDEIKFGDNDRLSALVATLLNADLLVILSDIDGLLDKDKKVVKLVPQISAQIKQLACPTDKKTCVGGMITKLEAAKIAVDSGIPCVIANGRAKDIILRIVKEPSLGDWTLFLPKRGSLAAKERWLAFSTKPKGRVIVDDGAKLALLNKKSLLSVGIVNSEGNFEKGDIVSVTDKENYEFARGKVVLSSKELEKVRGKRFDREIIHRDNIVIL